MIATTKATITIDLRSDVQHDLAETLNPLGDHARVVLLYGFG
jgi:hypothetical protein